MMKLSGNYVFTTRIKLNEDGDYVVLREPTMAEFQTLNGTDDDAIMKNAKKLFPKCVVESSVVRDDGTPASGDEIASLFEASSTTYTNTITEWLKSLPFRTDKDGK